MAVALKSIHFGGTVPVKRLKGTMLPGNRRGEVHRSAARGGPLGQRTAGGVQWLQPSGATVVALGIGAAGPKPSKNPPKNAWGVKKSSYGLVKVLRS